MYIFIDESGIHKTVGRSTFSVVYVEIPNLDKARKQLIEINKKLGIDSFHWAEQRWIYRTRYLKRVIGLDFIFKIATFENPVNTDLAFNRIFEHLIQESSIKSIAIDGKKPKWYERKLKKELRKHGTKVKKLRTIKNEASEPILQLADALAGFSLYVYENQDDKTNKRLLEQFRKLKKLLVEMHFY
ncbi:MAG: DUF3800 domain-containing protein [Candidatus Woesearchaeota archaeon]|jgi:hypothetical protein